MSITLSALQKQRRDTAANWTAENPTLLAGEIGLESDTGYWKVGNGSSAWNSLAYVPGLGAELPVSRLADGTARQLLQTAANGTDVEWTSNVDVPGTMDVTGAATFDGNVTVQGDLTVNGTEVIINTQTLEVEDKNVIIGKVATPTDVTADGGGITLKGTTDKTINWVDATDAWTLSEHVNIANSKEYRINGTKVLDATSLGSSVLITSANITDGTIVNGDVSASAAIAGTKISPDFGSQNVTTTGAATAAALIPSGSTVPTNGVYLPSANNVAISTNGVGRLFVDSSGRLGLGTSAPSSLLHLVSSGQPTITIADDGGRKTELRAPDSLANPGFIGTTSNHDLLIQAGTTAGGLNIMRFNTAGAERVRITDTGRVGIGTTSPQATLNVAGQIRIDNNTTDANDGAAYLFQQSGVGWNIASSNIAFTTGGVGARSERARIDSSGRLLVGTSTSTTGVSFPSQIQSNAFYAYSSSLFSADNSGSNYWFLKSRNATTNQHTAVQSGDVLGRLNFAGSDGDEFIHAALIQAVVDNGAVGTAVSNNECPAALVFSTTADGASSPTERMRITNGGLVVIGNTTATGIDVTSASATGTQFEQNGAAIHVRSAQTALFVGRQTDDGNLVGFYQAGVSEGSISVSGTTVSYNGAHLSRWSQLPGGAERTEILRGTVLSNIDEMCGWGDEDNEQLNRMKVSDVEGDPNVAGVFQGWDDDDDTYTDDFYCAMTGDFIIRIAEGVTVQRGDLLMSAGDGTAKPQDDDIIRSKTIAKVTSIHVTCTYDDGSYCVPCVLMAC